MPLTSQLVVSSRWPAVLIPKEPCPRSGAERKPFAGGVIVPGVNKLRSVKWRPLRGMSCTYLSLITCPILFVVVLRTAAPVASVIVPLRLAVDCASALVPKTAERATKRKARKNKLRKLIDFTTATSINLLLLMQERTWIVRPGPQ